MKENDLIAGRYRLLRPIGAGAMGSVWAARHEPLGRAFAIKIAKLSAQAPRQARERFMVEAQIVAQLRHPNIVDIADVGEHEGALYLAMELLVGESLGARIERGSLPPRDAARIVSEVARGLAVAHSVGIVHRDIKPENIFLARGSSGGMVPKLLDFGVSKAPTDVVATVSGELLGTPAYMSPEQASGELHVDHRTDLWSLGVVLYEALTQERPFTAPNYQALLPRIAESKHRPLPPHVPPELCEVVDRCLAKSRFDRYPSSNALREALEIALAAMDSSPELDSMLAIESARALPSTAPPPGVDWPRRSLTSVSDATLSPSMHQVPPSTRGRWAIGVVVGVGLTALGIGARFTVAPPVESPAASVVAAGIAPSSAPITPVSTPAAPAGPTSATADPSTSASANAPPRAVASTTPNTGAKPAPPKNIRGPGAHVSVTHVNSAGF